VRLRLRFQWLLRWGTNDPWLVKLIAKLATVDCLVYGTTALREVAKSLGEKLNSKQHESRCFALQVMAWLPSSLLPRLKLVYLTRAIELTLCEEARLKQPMLPALIKLIPTLKQAGSQQALLGVAKKLIKPSQSVSIQQKGLQLLDQLLLPAWYWLDPHLLLAILQPLLSSDNPTMMVLVFDVVAKQVLLTIQGMEEQAERRVSVPLERVDCAHACPLFVVAQPAPEPVRFLTEHKGMAETSRRPVVLLHRTQPAMRQHQRLIVPVAAKRPQARLRSARAVRVSIAQQRHERVEALKEELKKNASVGPAVYQALLSWIVYLEEYRLQIALLRAVVEQVSADPSASAMAWLPLVCVLAAKLAGTVELRQLCETVDVKSVKITVDYQLLALLIPHVADDDGDRQALTARFILAVSQQGQSLCQALLQLWSRLIPQAVQAETAAGESVNLSAVPFVGIAAEQVWLNTVMSVVGYEERSRVLTMHYCEPVSHELEGIPLAQQVG
jgi:hypothetical protein